ncbi:glycosyltransferase family 9 protein [Methanotorris igneus]|uniref:Glycosyl transferase family 9 n=1 Tax=Methanotorris igneus (strain DSM 5666 / JCM 11834 / Kol 5) TaxID=880724 RepID=F6BAX1_METIK|nr:glycosyltransferase family 9 protein [Methanotorris igneus]AEF97058.1 glycosyl transferase family 9 [Methanotorris igneus Kol 5]
MKRIYKNPKDLGRYMKYIKIVDFIGDCIFFYKKRKKFKKENIKKILVIRLDHIGDMILLSSFLRNLKNNFPNSEITVLCREMTKDVAECIPYIDAIQILNTPWLSRNDRDSWKKILKYIIKYYKKYDLVFDLRGNPLHNIIVSLIGKYSVGYGCKGLGFLLNKEIIWENKPKHTVDRTLDAIRALNLPVDSGKLELKIDEKYYKNLKNKLNSIDFDKDFIILCHPISGNKCKNWLFNYWNELNNLILKENENIIILYGGSKNDYYIINKNINIDNKRIFNIAGELSLKEYFALIDLCNLLISVDTFAVHARAAFNKPLIGIYSGTNYLHEWEPYTSKKIVFQDKSCPYYPCESIKCLLKEHVCMKNIRPEIVFEAYKKLRENYEI